jgi:hypothetical protein
MKALADVRLDFLRQLRGTKDDKAVRANGRGHAQKDSAKGRSGLGEDIGRRLITVLGQT